MATTLRYGTFIKMEPGMMEEWQKNNKSDHVHIVCKQCYNFRSLTRDVLRNISKFRWSLSHFLPISTYGFVPPVICLPALWLLMNVIIEKKIDFLNSRIDFYSKTIFTSLVHSYMTSVIYIFISW